MKKKILCLTLAAMMALSPTNAFAEETTNNIIYNEGATPEEFEQNITVTGSKGGEFVVAVPKVGNLDSGVDMSLKVGIYADIASDKKVVIAPVDSTPDETPDVCNFTIKNIVPVGFVGRDDIHGEITTIKTDFPYNDTAICTNRDDITNPENMVEICTYRADITAGEWQGNVGLIISLTDAETSEVPGLYDSNGIMLCSWEDSGIDIETNYTDEYYETTTSAYYVLANNYQTATNVVLPNSVTYIGDYAFSGCSNLTSVTVPNSVTSIGNNTFSSCRGLTSITIPNSVTSIGASAFGGCSNLTSIIIPDSVTSIGAHAFISCTGLTSITIPDSVTSIGSMAFGQCSNLASITMPNSVTSIDDFMFYACTSLASVTIPNSVTSIGAMAFGDCSNLASVTISDSVTSIGNNAFVNCSNLASVTIPNSVTSIGNMAFGNCSNLTSVVFENTSNWYTGNRLGDKTTALNSSDLSNTSIAATYLKSTYKEKFWTCSE